VFFLLIVCGNITSCQQQAQRDAQKAAEQAQRDAQKAAEEAAQARSRAMSIARNSYESSINDAKALWPNWYRLRFKPWTDGTPENTINPLLITILCLGLFFYPTWSLLLPWMFGETPDEPKEYMLLAAVGTVAFYLANILASSVLYGLFYLILSLFNSTDCYVPWGLYIILFAFFGPFDWPCFACVTGLGIHAEGGKALDRWTGY
jgi:hypothetical protein